MNKTLILSVPLCFLLAACESPAPKTQSTAFIPNCPKVPTNRPCPAQRNEIRLVVSAGGVDPRPPVVCTSAGDTIAVTVHGIPDHAKVATVPKDGVDGWILSSRTGDGEMSIAVPQGTPGGDYHYFALASTGECVDPVIRIVE
jgi:hypothetical protein